MFRFRAKALLEFLLLCVGLPAALTGQEAADSAQIPEVEREIAYTLSPIEGETGWKITPIVDEDTPRTGTPGAYPAVFVQNPFGAIRVQVRAVREPLIEARVEDRRPSTADFILTNGGASLGIVATPPDRARTDLTLTVPYRYLVQMATTTVRQRSMSLAAVSGGTVFTADSAEDLDSVYEQVARELRSVYTLSYRPLDQQFDGKWRRVRVRTKQKGIVVRTRPGYYAY